MKIKNILIPTDFSKNASNAIDFALSFFKDKEIKFTFLHTYHIPVVTPEMPSEIIFQSVEESKNAAKESLKELCKKTEKHFAKNCDFVIEQEPLSSACKKTVSEKKIDMIVMGTHGATGLKKLLFGSNAASIISSSACPVLAIPEKAKFYKMQSMLFATDYHDSDIDDIDSLSKIAESFNAEIIVVHMSEGKETNSNMLHWFEGLVKKKTSYKKISFFLLGKTDLIQSLDDFIEKNNVELVAMSTRKRSPFEKLFSPSMTKRMVYHTSIPLLTFHAKDMENEF